jgi:hypothetical protein
MAIDGGDIVVARSTDFNRTAGLAVGDLLINVKDLFAHGVDVGVVCGSLLRNWNSASVSCASSFSLLFLRFSSSLLACIHAC